MRIGLNAQLLSLSDSYRGAGIAHYIHQTLIHLPRAGAHTYIAFVADKAFRADGMEIVPSRLPTARPPVRILWEQTFLPVELARRGIDLLHAMAFVTPMLSSVTSVVTVYDVSFALFPESFRPFNRWYLTTMTRRSVRKARAVLAISQNTADDLHRLWGVPREKIHLAYCGVDDIFRPLPASEVASFREANGLPAQYILFVGTLEPRKNVVRLVEAFALLKKQDLPHKLVLAGGKGWMYEPIFAAVERLGLASDVIFPGFVPRQELPLWYNGAAGFVYPSLYEGFGLGPLEAMACGTPVVVSDRASLPEVVGDAGLTVPPDDVSALAEAMAAILREPSLAAQLRERGLRRAGEFTWERTAQATVQAYECVMSERRHV
ncbi:MAG: glycosyltransferase family 1 protein [Anaerolineae bacterium]|nr:glycosyltransferase family 1 protein [Anaerolineae bacterium]